MPALDLRGRLEPGVAELFAPEYQAHVSIAISLKRIADLLELQAAKAPGTRSVSLSADDLHALRGR